MGHIRNYTISDIVARYYRMLNRNVLHPMGWDAFGLPAEEAATKNNIEPYKWTYKNIKYMKKQLQSMGFSYDWTKEINTSDPKYYKWEQYVFLKLYKKKITYKKKSLVNWCEYDNTVLANEQVINGKCWRCHNIVTKKRIKQWFIKTKKYAKRLLKDIKYLKYWPKKVISMQKKWIGYEKKIKFLIQIKNEKKIFVYTSRIDTLCGVTFIAMFYKNKFIKNKIKTHTIIKQIFQKCKENRNKKIKKSYKTHFCAINPITKKNIPIWILNYSIRKNFKKKTIIACPAHNIEDWKFAKENKIEIIFVIKNKKLQKNNIIKKKPILKTGILYNSTKEINGLNSKDAIKIIIKKINENTKVYIKDTFRIKDWNISRQRQWGCPIPIATLENKKIISIPQKKLPVVLNYKIDNKKLKKEIIINGKKAMLENDTFDTFMESSWYYIRYTNPKYKNSMADPKATSYWLPIDFYIGGIEHATMHLIYFRLYCKILKDLKIINFKEPVKKLLCQGMVLSHAFYKFVKKEKVWISSEKVKIIKNNTGKIVKIIDRKDKTKVNYFGLTKMSKSKNNGVEPLKIIEKYGADSLRLFITFAAPIEESMEWKNEGVNGSYRFIVKIWNLSNTYLKYYIDKMSKINNKKLNAEQKKVRQNVHKTIVVVSNNMKEKKSFHTSIASIMKITNIIEKFCKKENLLIIIESIVIILKLLNPFIPHIIFYIFKKFHLLHEIRNKCWPKPDQQAILENTYKIVTQINGKKRYVFKIKKNTNKDTIFSKVKNNKYIKKYIINKKIKKIIFIQNKIINIVTN
ncbi:leucine--tRNA ligase [Buchnera aphidicola (Chaitoregma tattakana)]|uniref:leucine--tRNA ligase n=1 Tax=Buchnera aphidicola TaxID=9 RepID=UPI0031B85CC1